MIGVSERRWATISIYAAVRALVFIVGSLGSGVGDVGGMPEDGDRADHGAAVADRSPERLRLRQGRELLPRAATKWAAFFRQNAS